MAITDLNNAQVTLDEAESCGFMSYPDIYGKYIRLETRDGNTIEGEVIKIGPLGIIIRWRRELSEEISIKHTFAHWIAGLITWDHESIVICRRCRESSCTCNARGAEE